MKKNPQVVIHVEGGLVQAVYADTDIDVQIIDLDNDDADEDEEDYIDKSQEFLNKIADSSEYKQYY